LIRLVFILCCLPLLAFSQAFTVNDIAFVASTSGPGLFFPTNLPGGFAASGWWEPSRGAYVTNGGIATLPNLTSIGTAYDLTNSAGSTSPIREPSQLNGLATVYFAGATVRLSCDRWTNSSAFGSGYEAFIVMSHTNTSSGTFFGGLVGSPGTNWDFAVASSLLAVRQNSSIASTILLTNRYAVFDVVFSNATASVIYTNNVIGKPGNSGVSTNAYGLRVGADFQPANGLRFSLAALVTFTNQILTASARSNMFFYFTNRFNLSP